MRYFDIEGWEDAAGGRHEGEPDDLDDTFGAFVHVWDSNDPEFHEYFWTYTIYEFWTWDEWYDHIEDAMEQYGIIV